MSPKNHKKPWITALIKSYIKKRESYFLLLKRGLISRSQYNHFRNYVTNLIKTSKKNYYQTAFDHVKSDTKKTWKIINNMLSTNRKNNKKSMIEKIIANDYTITEEQEIVDILNDHFSTIGDKIASSIQPYPYDFSLNMPQIQENFSFSLVTPCIIKKIIMSQKNKKSNIYNYSIAVLKHISGLIAPVLTKLLNLSLLQGIFPDSLKIASVTPIFKGGDKTDVCNYRPISVLSTFSKIFEKVVAYQVNYYLRTNNILTPAQYGFRQGQSTTDALLNTLQYVYDNLDKNNTVISLFLDFSKAFDCVDHDILLRKLESYGIRDIELIFFKSYLSNREQYVSLSGLKSDKRTITRGVPQGSVLGPLLFLLFINDFPQCNTFFKFTLFADDSTLTCSFPHHNLNIIHETLNLQLISIDHWLRSNKLQINANKSNFIIYSYRNTYNIPPVSLGQNMIQQTTNTKFLGLYLDQHLKFNHHVQHISSKVSKTVGILHKLKHFFPDYALKILYNSLILPFISYGIEVWYATSDTLTSKISILQKKSIRAIHDLDYIAHTNDYFKNDNILKLQDLYKLQICSCLYKYNNLTNNEFHDRLIPHTNNHNHHTRNRNNLVLPQYTKATTQSSFLYQSINEWNNVPTPIQNSQSIYSFKRKLKGHYCSLY